MVKKSGIPIFISKIFSHKLNSQPKEYLVLVSDVPDPGAKQCIVAHYHNSEF
jgi:hypothetical protein